MFLPCEETQYVFTFRNWYLRKAPLNDAQFDSIANSFRHLSCLVKWPELGVLCLNEHSRAYVRKDRNWKVSLSTILAVNVWTFFSPSQHLLSYWTLKEWGGEKKKHFSSDVCLLFSLCVSHDGWRERERKITLRDLHTWSDARTMQLQITGS